MKEIPGFPGYLVNADGLVASKTGRVLSVRYNRYGYPCVALRKPNGTKGDVAVHRLVALAFLGPRPYGLEVRHLDGNAANPVVANLAYGTSSENRSDSVLHGTHAMTLRTHCPHGHAYTPGNTYIAPGDGGRRCRICIRAQRLEWKRTHRDRKAS